MALLRFFKPKWQHHDPAIRRQAVQAMSSEDDATLTKIASEDEAPSIRRLALRRINDLAVIHAAAHQDSDKDVREFAQTRLSQLLAGNRQESPALERRLDFLSLHPEEDLLKFVALNGSETELRKSIQDRISRESVLRDIAINDPVAENRLAALERISQTTVLEAVYRQTRKSDKQVSRQARARLDARREAEERPARIRAESEQICARMESLGHSDRWEQDQSDLQRLENRWLAVADETDEVYRERYASARQAFVTAFAAFRAARDAEEREWANIRTARQALLAQIEQRLAELQDSSALAADKEADDRAELTTWRTRWQEMPDLPVNQAQALNRRFQQVMDSIKTRLDELHQYRAMETTLQSLNADAERLLKTRQPVREQQVKALEKRWKAEHISADTDELKAAIQHLETAMGQLRARLRRQLEQRDTEFEKLPQLFDQLQALLDEKALKRAGPMRDRIQTSLSHLQALGISRQRLAPFSDRLHAMTPRIRELQSWRKWGADEVRERLCTEMEALIGRDMEPRDLATEVSRLRTEWNRLRADGSATQRTLWKRFDKAADQAYRPCQAFFKQQAAERTTNLEAKRQLCEQLDAYLASADWSHMDWKAAHKMQQRFSNDWRRAGPVDRRESKDIAQRYHQAMETLNEHLDRERQRNLRQRHALIEKVAALQSVEDIHAAIEECKQLQKQWQTTVPGKRHQEDAIWKEFRDACDAVFARRRQQQDERHQAQQDNKLKKQQLCESLESLSATSIDALTDAERQLHKLISEWEDIGAAAKNDQAALEQRFSKARQTFEAHRQALLEGRQRTQLELLRHKAALCLELEQLLEQPDQALVEDRVQAIDERWHAEPALDDSATEQGIQQRYARAISAVMAGGQEQQRLSEELAANLDRRLDLCLRMEILAGVESPPEAQQARLQLQTQRLAGAIGQGVGDIVGTRTKLEHDWYLCGPAPVDQQALLQQRFDTARETGQWHGGQQD
jgi:exonuclease SbcC